MQIGTIRRLRAREQRQVFGDVQQTCAGVVEIPFGGAKVALDPAFVGAFDENADAQIAAVEKNPGRRCPRAENSILLKELAGQRLRQPAGILGAVVQVNLAQAVKQSSFGKFVEIEGQRRPVVNRPKAIRAFKVHRDVGVHLIAFAHGSVNVDAPRVLRPQVLVVCPLDLHSFGRNLDLQFGDRTGEELIGDVFFFGQGATREGECQNDG